MKHKYILMCALAMMSFATQAQDDVLYEVSSESATEVVDGHIYVLQNRAYPAYGLFYDNNNGCASTYEWNEDVLGQCMPYQYFFLTAGAYGITLPVTLININDNGEMDYGNTGGGTVLSRPSYAPNPDEPVYFTVKDAAGQLAMIQEGDATPYGVIYGGENTTPAENAQWIAYEATEHVHNWEIVYYDEEGHSYSNYHHCTKDGCDVEERHYVTGENGVCVCGYQCSEHSYHMDDYASVEATENADGQYIVVKICEYCQHEKTETVDPDGECPEGGNHSWADDGTINATCTAKGYTYHICKKCEMLYVADFTPVDLNNHNWVVEQQWNEADEFVSMHFCCNGCEAHGNLEEHTMDENGKCTVCGYWPGHTEHQWEAEPESHHCTIPGCEEHGSWTEHEMDGCVCTICGYTEHCWDDGVCENCGAECDHKNHWYEEARDATCIKDGNKGFYVCVCDLFFADADCTEKITWEDIYLPATGHQFDEEHHCTVCDRSITIGSTITLGEAAYVDFINYCGRYNEEDPTAEPLYKIELTKAAYNFSISEELDSPSIAIFDKDFNYILTVHVDDPNFLEAGTYYLLPSAYSEDEDEGGYVEFACTNVPLNITRIESITLNPEEVTDVNGDEVVLTLTDNGYATNQTIAIDDSKNFYSDIEFSVPEVTYTRDISGYAGSDWGTLCLPFDYTVAEATAVGLSIYELTDASAEAVTVTRKTEGTVAYGTPVLFKKTGEGDGATLNLTAADTKMGYVDDSRTNAVNGLYMLGALMGDYVNTGYYLDTQDGKLHSIEEWCSANNEDEIFIPAYRAWFDRIDGDSNEARSLNVEIEDETSALDAIRALTQGKAIIYGLDGRERNDLQPGVNIVNGMKVIVKN